MCNLRRQGRSRIRRISSPWLAGGGIIIWRWYFLRCFSFLNFSKIGNRNRLCWHFAMWKRFLKRLCPSDNSLRLRFFYTLSKSTEPGIQQGVLTIEDDRRKCLNSFYTSRLSLKVSIMQRPVSWCASAHNQLHYHNVWDSYQRCQGVDYKTPKTEIRSLLKV